MQTTLRILKKLLFKLHRLVIKSINSYTKIIKHPFVLLIRTLIRVSILLFLVLTYYLMYFHNINLSEYLSAITDNIVFIATAISLLTSTFANEIGEFFKGFFRSSSDDSGSSGDSGGIVNIPKKVDLPKPSSVNVERADDENNSSWLNKFKKALEVLASVPPKSQEELDIVQNQPLAGVDDQKGGLWQFTKNNYIWILASATIIAGGVYLVATAEPETLKGVFGSVMTGITTILSKNPESDTTTGSASLNEDGSIVLEQSSRYSVSSLFKRLFNPFKSRGGNLNLGDSDVPDGGPFPYDPSPSPAESDTTVRHPDLSESPRVPLTKAELRSKHSETLAIQIDLEKKLQEASDKKDDSFAALLRGNLALNNSVKDKYAEALAQLPRTLSDDEIMWGKVRNTTSTALPESSTVASNTSLVEPETLTPPQSPKGLPTVVSYEGAHKLKSGDTFEFYGVIAPVKTAITQPYLDLSNMVEGRDDALAALKKDAAQLEKRIVERDGTPEVLKNVEVIKAMLYQTIEMNFADSPRSGSTSPRGFTPSTILPGGFFEGGISPQSTSSDLSQTSSKEVSGIDSWFNSAKLKEKLTNPSLFSTSTGSDQISILNRELSASSDSGSDSETVGASTPRQLSPSNIELPRSTSPLSDESSDEGSPLTIETPNKFKALRKVRSVEPVKGLNQFIE